MCGAPVLRRAWLLASEVTGEQQEKARKYATTDAASTDLCAPALLVGSSPALLRF